MTDKLSATIDELKKFEQIILTSLSNEVPAAPARLGPKPKATTAKAKAAAKKTGKRGAVKEQIVAALQKSGAKGISDVVTENWTREILVFSR